MIKALFISREHGSELVQTTDIEVVAGAGIVGDRNFNKKKWSGQNITFIESEVIKKYNEVYKQNITPESTRRNVITSDIDLNSLVDKTFTIGDTKFKGVKLCEPCKNLGELLENDTISKTEVIKAFVHRGGLRADVFSDGLITTGMNFKIESDA